MLYENMPSSTASDIRDYVAAKQLPQAAKAAKDALDRGAHVQLATGILLGIGAQDVNENMAASLCLCFQDMLTCDAGARREMLMVTNVLDYVIQETLGGSRAEEPSRVAH